MGKKGQMTPDSRTEFREKGQKKAVFWGPAGPRKRGLFWTLPWILKVQLQALWSKTLKVSIETCNGEKKEARVKNTPYHFMDRGVAS